MLIVCNDQNNPNTAAQCARQAIKDKVTALVGGLEDYDLQIEPLLNQAGIPWVGLTTADDYTTPNLFLFGGQGVDGFAAAGMTLAQHGCKKIAIIVTAAAGTQKINAADIAAGIHAGGATGGNGPSPSPRPPWTWLRRSPPRGRPARTASPRGPARPRAGR